MLAEKTKPGASAPGFKGCNCLRVRQFLFVVVEVSDIDAGDHRAQLLRGFEHGNWTSRDFYWRTGPGVTGHPRLAVPDLEGAKAANLNVLLGLQRFLDRVEEGIDDSRAVLLGDHRPSGT